VCMWICTSRVAWKQIITSKYICMYRYVYIYIYMSTYCLTWLLWSRTSRIDKVLNCLFDTWISFSTILAWPFLLASMSLKKMSFLHDFVLSRHAFLKVDECIFLHLSPSKSSQDSCLILFTMAACVSALFLAAPYTQRR